MFKFKEADKNDIETPFYPKPFTAVENNRVYTLGQKKILLIIDKTLFFTQWTEEDHLLFLIREFAAFEKIAPLKDNIDEFDDVQFKHIIAFLKAEGISKLDLEDKATPDTLEDIKKWIYATAKLRTLIIEEYQELAEKIRLNAPKKEREMETC